VGYSTFCWELTELYHWTPADTETKTLKEVEITGIHVSLLYFLPTSSSVGGHVL
jgi:hypothetical protein